MKLSFLYCKKWVKMTSKVEARVGKTTDSAVRYVLGLMVQKGLIEQIHSDGRVLFGKKN